MSKLYELFLFSVVMLLSFLLVAAVVGCKPADKVSNQDVQIARLIQQMNEQQLLFTAISNDMANLIATTNLATANQQAQYMDMQNHLTALQVQLNAMIVQIAILEGYTNVVAILDPCGDSPSAIDEVLLQLSDGTILASFSGNGSALSVRLAILPNGNYSTTDGTNCQINIQNGIITW